MTILIFTGILAAQAQTPLFTIGCQAAVTTLFSTQTRVLLIVQA
jgi:hypothetical protein